MEIIILICLGTLALAIIGLKIGRAVKGLAQNDANKCNACCNCCSSGCEHKE